MRSTHFYLTFGVNEGFSKNNTKADRVEVSEKIKEFILKIEEETGVYVSGVIVKNYALYKDEWECPTGGEVTFTYMGDRNNSFCKNDRLYRKCVRKLAQMIKEEYSQEEIIVSFSKSSLTYIN